MSVKVMALIWDHYPEGGGELLVALKVADHADHDGSRIWPAVASLAVQTRQSERTVQRHLRAMSERGWLQLVRKGGTGPGATAHYRIPMAEILEGLAGKGDNLSPIARVTPEAEKGDKSSKKGDTAVSPEPSLKATVLNRQEAVPAEASPVAALFKQYRQGIQDAYSGEYPASAAANGILAKLARTLGREPASRVIDYYLATKKPYYVTRKHAIEILAKDATELWLELQAKSATPEGAKPPKNARTYLVLESGKEARLDDYPAADHLTIAKKVVADYGRMIHAKHAKSVAVLLGAERRIYDIDELRA